VTLRSYVMCDDLVVIRVRNAVRSGRPVRAGSDHSALSAHRRTRDPRGQLRPECGRCWTWRRLWLRSRSTVRAARGDHVGDCPVSARVGGQMNCAQSACQRSNALGEISPQLAQPGREQPAQRAEDGEIEPRHLRAWVVPAQYSEIDAASGSRRPWRHRSRRAAPTSSVRGRASGMRVARPQLDQVRWY